MSQYQELLNVNDFKQKEEFSPERWDVTFYCKDCKKIVETQRPNPKGYTFVCNVCKSKNIAIGTLEGIKATYRIK